MNLAVVRHRADAIEHMRERLVFAQHAGIERAVIGRDGVIHVHAIGPDDGVAFFDRRIRRKGHRSYIDGLGRHFPLPLNTFSNQDCFSNFRTSKKQLFQNAAR
jgi:hypothetical protein